MDGRISKQILPQEKIEPNIQSHRYSTEQIWKVIGRWRSSNYNIMDMEGDPSLHKFKL